MDKGFGFSIHGALNDLEILCQGVDALVVAAVDHHVRAKEGMEKAAGLVVGGVKGILFRMLVKVLVFHISDGAAKVEIDQLHPFADTEHRFFLLTEKMQG